MGAYSAFMEPYKACEHTAVSIIDSSSSVFRLLHGQAHLAETHVHGLHAHLNLLAELILRSFGNMHQGVVKGG